jgi:putative alpha-1,2-mannosidase
MGIYPLAPGDPMYSIGLPLFDEVNVNLENGKVFTITAENRTTENPYVKEVYLNGEKLTEPYIAHQNIMDGASLRFVMGPEKLVFWK